MNNLVYLRWLDSAIELDWSQASQDGHGLTEIETVGYVIFENDTETQVAQSNYGNLNSVQLWQFRRR
jgi:hypothetical protein